MKSKRRPGTALSTGAVLMVVVAPLAGGDSRGPSDTSPANIVSIQTSSLERIVREPEYVLAHEQEFWSQDRAMLLIRKWAASLDYQIPYDRWREKVRSWSELTPPERASHPLMRVSQALVEGKEGFLQRAIPHVASFFPPGTDLSVTIQLTAFSPSYAFAMEDIVLSVDSQKWQNDVQVILNLVAHEISHVGYSACRGRRTEDRTTDSQRYKMLDSLQGEGLCTYVGYTAQSFAPARGWEDYRLLEDSSEVESARRVVTAAFEKVGSVSSEELNRWILDKCVEGRAYYTLGAHMCRTIDLKRGRQELIRTLTSGPLRFVAVYNDLVDTAQRLKID